MVAPWVAYVAHGLGSFAPAFADQFNRAREMAFRNKLELQRAKAAGIDWEKRRDAELAILERKEAMQAARDEARERAMEKLYGYKEGIEGTRIGGRKELAGITGETKVEVAKIGAGPRYAAVTASRDLPKIKKDVDIEKQRDLEAAYSAHDEVQAFRKTLAERMYTEAYTTKGPKARRPTKDEVDAAMIAEGMGEKMKLAIPRPPQRAPAARIDTPENAAKKTQATQDVRRKAALQSELRKAMRDVTATSERSGKAAANVAFEKQLRSIHAEMRGILARELGREPTGDEIDAALAIR
jgi:hypothetical protein